MSDASAIRWVGIVCLIAAPLVAPGAGPGVYFAGLCGVIAAACAAFND